jgi:hypothetical protein
MAKKKPYLLMKSYFLSKLSYKEETQKLADATLLSQIASMQCMNKQLKGIKRLSNVKAASLDHQIRVAWNSIIQRIKESQPIRPFCITKM